MSDLACPPEIHEISGSTYIKYHGTDAHVVIPDGITVIGESAFEGCTALASVTMHEGITEIGSSAFEGCYRLKSIELPDSVTTIRFAAFEGCASLKAIQLPLGITAIEKWTFKDCAALTDIVIPDGVTEIGHSAFRDCYELDTLTLPESLIRIGETAFRGCSALTSITIPDSVQVIENWAFRDCTKLQQVSIHESTLLREGVFLGCGSFDTNMRSAVREKTVVKSSVARRKPIPDDWLIIDGVLSNYSGTAAHVEIPHTVTEISPFAFGKRSHITRITVPPTVTEIGEGSFDGCEQLAEAIVAEGSCAEHYFKALGIPCSYMDPTAEIPIQTETVDNDIDDLRLDAEALAQLQQEAEELERLRRETREAKRLQREAEEAERLRREAEEAQLQKEEAEAKRLKREAADAERLRRDAENAANLRRSLEDLDLLHPTQEAQKTETAAHAQSSKEATAKRKRYDKLSDDIARQDYIIATNTGWFGKEAAVRKEAEKRRAMLQAQRAREFPNGRPK